MNKQYLINGPISAELIYSHIEKISNLKDSGGHSIFIGQVREDELNGKKVNAIEYSAYETMVKVEADRIKEAIRREFSDTKAIEIIHSTGIVNTGEVSLFIIVSAGHRQHAIQACAKAVELIKDKLPVWKKEIYDDDSHLWKQNR